MREMLYLYRTERQDYVACLLAPIVKEKILKYIKYKYKDAANFLQLSENDFLGCVDRAYLIALNEYNYNDKRAATFSTFFNSIAIRETQKLLNQNSTLSDRNFNTIVLSYDSNPNTIMQINSIAYVPPKIDEYQTNEVNFLQKIKLKPFEKEILSLKLAGKKNKEIELILGLSNKKIANAYEKIKRLAKEYVYNN